MIKNLKEQAHYNLEELKKNDKNVPAGNDERGKVHFKRRIRPPSPRP